MSTSRTGSRVDGTECGRVDVEWLGAVVDTLHDDHLLTTQQPPSPRALTSPLTTLHESSDNAGCGILAGLQHNTNVGARPSQSRLVSNGHAETLALATLYLLRPLHRQLSQATY